MTFDRINPLSGEIASTSAAMSPENARAAADRAAAAFAEPMTGRDTVEALNSARAVEGGCRGRGGLFTTR